MPFWDRLVLGRRCTAILLRNIHVPRHSLEANLESFGVFGEIYVDLTERLTFTGGLRYNDDKKDVTARTTLISFLNPYANDGEPFDSPITP